MDTGKAPVLVFTSVALVTIILMGAQTTNLPMRAPTSNQVASTSTETEFSRTLPCGSPGVICGGSKVVSDSLVTYMNGSSALTMTVQNVGYGNLITSLQVTVNNTSKTVVGTASTHLKPGNQTTVSFLLTPNEIQVSPGKTYTFVLDAWDGASEDSGSIFTVIASQQTTTTSVTTNLGFAPSVQIANTSFAATVGSGLTIRFNVTTYQPGTLYWSIANGTGQTAFMSLFQIESGEVVLPNGVTATYPDGISSNSNRSDVAVVLAFAPLTAGKTIPLQLDVWLVPQSDPQRPIGTAESVAVTVAPGPRASLPPLALVGAGILALVVVVVTGLVWHKEKVSKIIRPTSEVGRFQTAGPLCD